MEKKNSIIKILAFIGVGLLLILGIFFLFTKVIFKNNNNNIKSNAQSFFLRSSKESKYALYGKDGSKKTDFIYKYRSDFINGYALVTYSDSSKAIIDENGKEIIKKGEYKYIFYSGGTYLLISSGNKNTKLLDSKLNVIMEKPSLSMLTVNAKGLSAVTDKNKVYVYSVSGKLMYEFKAKNYTTSADLYINESSVDKVASIFYNKKNYVFDTKQEKFIIAVDSDSRYGVSLADTKNRNSFVVYGNKDYIVLNNKVVAEKEKDSIKLNNYNIFYNDKVILNKNGEIGIEFDKDSKITYNSSDSYLKEIKDSKKIEVYLNGKLTTTIDGILTRSGIASGYVEDPFYIIRNKDKYLLVDKNGKTLMSYDFILTVKAKENYVKVKENKRYYYVDLNNKELTPKSDVDNIIKLGERYYFKKSNKLIDCKTNEEIDYQIYTIPKNDEDIYAVLYNTKTSKYVLFDIKNYKIVGEYNKSISTYKDYYQVDSKYYSYINNKAFYDVKSN